MMDGYRPRLRVQQLCINAVPILRQQECCSIRSPRDTARMQSRHPNMPRLATCSVGHNPCESNTVQSMFVSSHSCAFKATEMTAHHETPDMTAAETARHTWPRNQAQTDLQCCARTHARFTSVPTKSGLPHHVMHADAHRSCLSATCTADDECMGRAWQLPTR